MTRQEPSMKDVRQKREPARLTGKLETNLFTYAIAASAAGVGLMALSQAAEAKVIATQANIVVPINGGLVQFDINGDGVPDFGLSATTFLNTFTGGVRHAGKPLLGGVFGGHLRVVPAQAANEVGVHGSIGTTPCAADLHAGVRIGPAFAFDQNTILMAGIIGTGCAGSSQAYCNWKGSHPPEPFLPVKFTDTSGLVHYAWVRISVQQSDTTHFNATITGYAYETTPNMHIFAGATGGADSDASFIDPAGVLAPKAPEAASLGMLALGAPGLAAWRRQEEEEQAAA